MSKMLAIVFIFIIFVLSAPVRSNQCAVDGSVVVILANDSQNNPISQGTGFFYDKSGYIMTVFHVIEGYHNLNVRTKDGHVYPVKNLIATDPTSDLACFSVDIPSQLVYPIKLNATPPEVEDKIKVVGYPKNLKDYVISRTEGTVSSILDDDRYGGKLIQNTAPISNGSSGSPVINMKCEAIGVVCFSIYESQESQAQNQNFAISCNQVFELINKASLAKDGEPISKWNLTSEEQYYATGMDQYRKGMYNEAIQLFDKAIELDPHFADAWNEIGNVLKAKRNYSEAIDAYNKAIDIEPKFAWAWNGKGIAWNEMGLALNDQGNYSEAIDTFNKAIDAFNKAIEIEPGHPEAQKNLAKALMGKGIALNSLGEHEEAIKAYDEAIQLDPNNSEVWNHKGNTLEAQGNYNEAIDAYNESILLAPKSPNSAWPWNGKGYVWNKMGFALNNEGNYREAIDMFNKAIDAFNKAIELEPVHSEAQKNLANAWMGKGIALNSMGEHEEAIKAYDEAIQLDPNNFEVWNHEGNTLEAQGNYSEAIVAYNESIRLAPKSPNSAWPWNGIGIVLHKQGKNEEAVKAYEEAIKLDSNLAVLLYNKGEALELLGRTTEADAAFTRAKELGYK